MTEEVVFTCKSACAITAPIVIAEESMFCRLVDPLMSSQIFRCDESFAADSTDLCLGAVPAGVMAIKLLATCIYSSHVQSSEQLTPFRTLR